MRVEDLAFGAETAVCAAVVGKGGNAVIAGCEEDGVALEAELEELVALAFGVVDWEVGFGLAVGGTDYVGGFVDTALELAWAC